MIDVNMKSVNTSKSYYLNHVLGVKNRKGKEFQKNIRPGVVLTESDHAIWFAEVQNGPNHFFNHEGSWFVDEALVHPSWDDLDRAAEKFQAGESAVRSVVCRYESGANRYFGEFELVSLSDSTRRWRRIATKVDL